MSTFFQESAFSRGSSRNGTVQEFALSGVEGRSAYTLGSGVQSYSVGSGAQFVAGSSSASGASVANQVASDLLQLQGSRAASVGYGSSAVVGSGSASARFGSSGAQYGSSSARYGSSGAQYVSSGAQYSSSSAVQQGVSAYLSEVEAAILRSTVPIELNETEEITVNGHRGVWANRAEVVNWRGVVPITEYLINEDANPEVITKRSSQQLVYVQELAVRYLRPPTPPAPGEIVITQEPNVLTPPAPPLVIRQQPARPSTPEPLVLREAPPPPPPQVGRKLITISGRRIPPAPRKVVVERLAALPAKPQAVLVERWLPYAQVKRRVIFQRSQQQDPVVVRPRNVIVQWEAPRVEVRREFRNLGVVRANPAEYVQRYGASLKQARDLPQFVRDIQAPDGLVLAANYQYNNVHELEGDVQALRLVDLDHHGLSEYRQLLASRGLSFVGAAGVHQAAAVLAGNGANYHQVFSSQGGAQWSSAASAGNAAQWSSAASSAGNAAQWSSSASSASSSAVVEQVFASVDADANGYLSLDEAQRVLRRLNVALGRSYNDNDAAQFFVRLDSNRDGRVSLAEFRQVFLRLL